MEKKSAKKAIKMLFYKLCFWQSKVPEIFEKALEPKKEIRSERECNDFVADNHAVRLNATIADVYGNRDGIVTIVSDDGFYESGVLLNELAKKHKVCVSVAGAVTYVKPYLKEWRKIIGEGYVEMINHSYKHIALREDSEISRDRDKLYYELVRSAKWFENKFPENGKQISFVCPENTMCELGYNILANNNVYAVRRGNRGFNSLSPREGVTPGEWFNLKVQGIRDDVFNSTKIRTEWVDNAADKHLWLIEMWHNVMKKQDGLYQTILEDEADEHLAYISKLQEEKRIWVATLTDATKYIREKQNTYVEAYMKKGIIYIKAKMNSKLPIECFNYPLTVCIDLPQDVNGKLSHLNEKHIFHSKEGKICFDIVPDGKIHEFKIKKEY